MKLTAANSGYFVVYVNGVEKSKHTSEREAIEAAVNAELANPGADVQYKHDYTVKVETAVTVPAPPPPPARRMFHPNDWSNKTLPANAKLHEDNAAIWAYMQGAVVDKAHGGTSTYFGNIAVNEYSATIFIVTDPAIPKTKLALPGKEFTELHKELQSVGHRLPPNMAGSDGTDGACVVWDQVDDTMLECWQYRIENGQHVMSWGAVLKDVSNRSATIAPLPFGERQGSRACSIALSFGLIKLEELAAGKIPHPLAILLPNCARGVWTAPAERTDGWDNNPSIVKMGTLFRLPANYQAPATSAPIVRMICDALRDYGAYVIDTTQGHSVNFQCEDIGHKAPAGQDPNEWALAQYAPYFDNKWAYELMMPITRGGQMPWDLIQAVAFPVTAV